VLDVWYYYYLRLKILFGVDREIMPNRYDMIYIGLSYSTNYAAQTFVPTTNKMYGAQRRRTLFEARVSALKVSWRLFQIQ